ncbi:MAG: ATP-binding protein [Bdellovibrionota bacterium]
MRVSKNGTIASSRAAHEGLFTESPDGVPILLVDDREENLVALEAVLRNPGYRLIKTQSGDDALRYLLDNIPALILMDVQMPGLDGYETAAIIKSNPRTREIPIIFITAINTDERFLHRGYEYGAIDYIYKPFDSQVLRSKVAVLADLHRKTERLVQAEKALRETEALERERRIAELELRALRREQIEQKRYRNLVESIDHGIVWSAVPDSMALSFVSGSATKLTGHSSDELLASPELFLSLIPESDRAAFLAAAQRATQSSAETRVEHRLITANGREAWFHTGIRASARPDGIGNELRGLSVDITPLKRAEKTLYESKRRSDILAQTSLLLADSLDCASPLRALVSYLQAKAFDFCALEAFDLATGFHAVATGQPERDAIVLETFISHPGSFPENTQSDWCKGKSRVWRNVNEAELLELVGDSTRATAVGKLGLHSFIQVGLAMRGHLLGVLTLGFGGDSSPTEADASLTDDIAYRISSAMENSSLYLKAETAIRLRDEFLSIASHELRTPLTPLKIRVQQMQRLLDNNPNGQLPSEQLNKTVQTCHRQIERLSKLIDDLLDISRISRGKLSLHPEVFDLSELIRDIITRFGGQMEAAGCQATLDLDEKLEVTLDLSRIEQVIVNLLTNAIKYAPGKPIEIKARRVGEEVEISLRDHGIGIAVEDQERIFQRFERAVSSSHFGGLGLGLYIVSQILGAHGGRISVSSLPGEGAQFSVRLPLRVTESAAALDSAV